MKLNIICTSGRHRYDEVQRALALTNTAPLTSAGMVDRVLSGRRGSTVWIDGARVSDAMLDEVKQKAHYWGLTLLTFWFDDLPKG